MVHIYCTVHTLSLRKDCPNLKVNKTFQIRNKIYIFFYCEIMAEFIL